MSGWGFFDFFSRLFSRQTPPASASSTVEPYAVPVAPSAPSVPPVVPPPLTAAPAAEALPSVSLGQDVPPEGVALIKHWEKCILSPYLDSGGVPTIGWGDITYMNGKPVSMTDPKLTQAEADLLLKNKLEKEFWPNTRKLLPEGTPSRVAGAFLSLAWNIGYGDKGLAGSTAIRKLRAGDLDGALAAMELWKKDNGKTVKGLQRRRRSEILVAKGYNLVDAVAAAIKAYP